MKELGEILRQKRESSALDLDRVHRATKIQEKYIIAIEEGDDSVFSAEIYYKSFVKSYAKLLGLNGEELLSLYEQRKCSKEEALNEQAGKRGKKSCKSPNEKNNDLKKLFVTVVIAGVLFAAFLYMNKRIPILDNSDRVSALEQKKIRLQKIDELQQQKEQEARERHLQETTIAEQKSKIERNDNKVRDQNAKTTPTQTANRSQSIQTGSNSAAVIKQQRERQELIIDAVENVWIRVEGDGKEVFQGTVVKGTKKTWKANDEFTVKIGYTPGVDVYFNGAEVDIDKDAVQDVNTLVLKGQR